MRNAGTKPVMVIVSTLFFNRIGNQSLLETVKQYSRKYHIVFITSASKRENYYMDMKKALTIFGTDITFFHVYQTLPVVIKFLLGIFLKKRKESNPVSVSGEFTNTTYGKLNILSAKVAAVFLYRKLLYVIKRYNPSIVCAYEVFAVRPVLKARKKYANKHIKYLAKFQGTVLGFDYQKINDPAIYKRYSFDIEAFRLCNQFDVCAITNDGTNGDKVLSCFGVNSDKILYEPNGISQYIKDIKQSIRIDNTFDDIKTINLFTLSRLIGWKRIYLSIEIMHRLVNIFNCHRYALHVYGHGSDSEIKVLEDLIKKYKLSPCVHLYGAVEHDDLIDVYNQNHVMLSLYKYTNVTNPIFEALYLNKPVITLHDNSLDSILKKIDTDRVFLFDDTTDDGIIDVISTFLNTHHFQFLKKNNHVVHVFDWETRINNEFKLLNG
ncbi:hypothetical protein HMPREF1222_02447 [Treponema vincentii F0403]|uniref:Glycosyl transferase family 1 domain-containing protein n=2 Tax=Treponema vincentii TaxID=69710 RepID=S3LN95_9SPIR|nr:hypothetical protein HMPREF1222_02447 [Treponema vincentii F0403]